MKISANHRILTLETNPNLQKRFTLEERQHVKHYFIKQILPDLADDVMIDYFDKYMNKIIRAKVGI